LAFDKAIKIDSLFANAYYNRGIAYANLNKIEMAINDFGKAILINTLDYKSYYNRGNLKMQQENFEGALIDFDKAIEIYPKYERAYSNRATTKAFLKDYNGAIKDYDFIIELNPLNVSALYNRATTKATKPAQFLEKEIAVQSFTQAFNKAIFDIEKLMQQPLEPNENQAPITPSNNTNQLYFTT
jgi:tetratricopeptide (TPR) repeat protein